MRADSGGILPVILKVSMTSVFSLIVVSCGGDDGGGSAQFGASQVCDPRFDLNEDGFVDSNDLATVLAAYSETPQGQRVLTPEDRKADFDGNGVVDGSDVGALLGCWSTSVQ